MTKRILLINSDIAKNRGDRAITEGVMELLKHNFPNAVVTGISERAQRDSKWYGAEFLDMSFQSLNPVDFIKLMAEARKSDLIFWGGGEILKDYTNKAALWYWVMKIWMVSLVNKNVYGMFQGIGPTHSSVSKKLIVSVVGRCKRFIVRDKESYEKLISWGALPATLLHSSDPAVLPKPNKVSKELKQKLNELYGLEDKFLSDFVCIGPRDWFHYKPGGILPFRYKRLVYSFFGKKLNIDNTRHDTYIQQLKLLITELVDNRNKNVLFVPMHTDEDDTALCHMLKDAVKNPNRVRILDEDHLSPADLRSVISQAKAMIGFRLHSNIVGISAGVPSINIYYVDKGRVFFDQVHQSKFAIPIELLLEDSFIKTFVQLFDELEKNTPEIRQQITQQTNKLRKSVTLTFEKIL